jgi:hypothetical protein
MGQEFCQKEYGLCLREKTAPNWRRPGKGMRKNHEIYLDHHCMRMQDGITGSADQGSITHQFAEADTEETGDIRKQIFFRFREAVLPVGDGSAHQVEELVTAGPGHSFPFSQDPEFGSETHGITAFRLVDDWSINRKP